MVFFLVYILEGIEVVNKGYFFYWESFMNEDWLINISNYMRWKIER